MLIYSIISSYTVHRTPPNQIPNATQSDSERSPIGWRALYNGVRKRLHTLYITFTLKNSTLH